MGFIPFTFIDLIDIVSVAAIMYWIYRMTKGTNAPYILSGIIAIYLLWVVVRTLNMELLSTILGQLISVGAIALIIVFQPELRRFLQMIGMRSKHFNFITRIFSSSEDNRERPRCRRQVHPARDPERRSQVLWHAASCGHRHERDFGCRDRRGLRGDRRHFGGPGRAVETGHRTGAVAADFAALSRARLPPPCEKGGRRIAGRKSVAGVCFSRWIAV